MAYTASALLAATAVVAVEVLWLRTGLLRRRSFWVAYAICVFFQVLVDGWLTCRPIVTYAEEQFSSIRLGCPASSLFSAGGMPLEDVVFGFAMITQTLMWWVWWGRRLGAEG